MRPSTPAMSSRSKPHPDLFSASFEARRHYRRRAIAVGRQSLRRRAPADRPRYQRRLCAVFPNRNCAPPAASHLIANPLTCSSIRRFASGHGAKRWPHS